MYIQEWGEFMSRGGDTAHIEWNKRRHKVLAVLEVRHGHGQSIRIYHGLVTLVLEKLRVITPFLHTDRNSLSSWMSS